MKKLMLILFLLVSSNVFARTYELASNDLKLFKISKFGPTRIAFVEERIADVFFYPEVAAKVVLHKTGAIFVVPNEGQKLVYLTIIGDKGAVQDLRLRYVAKEPQPILISGKLDMGEHGDVGESAK